MVMKKVLASVMAVATLALAIAGCGKKDDKKFVVGFDQEFPPMGFVADDGSYAGFDLDLAQECAKRMGREFVAQPIAWDSKDQELKSGNIDCIWNGFTKTPEREENMTLSMPYMKNTQVVVVLSDSDIYTIADLAGKVVDVQSGSSAELAIDSIPDVKASFKELVAISDNVKAMMDLGIAGADAVVMDEVVARYYMAKSEGQYRLLDEKLADEEYVIGFKKGNDKLKDEVELALRSLKEDGTLAQIAEKWFGADITTVE